MLALRPENVQPLPSGSLVELCGLSIVELNGMVGTIEGGLQHSAKNDMLRYAVRLANGSEKSVKGANLKPRSRLWDLGKALSAPVHRASAALSRFIFMYKCNRCVQYRLAAVAKLSTTRLLCETYLAWVQPDNLALANGR